MPPSVCTELTQAQQTTLLALARTAIESRLDNQPAPRAPSEESIFHKRLGVFVTLKKFGQLRGCIGVFEGVAPLADSAIDCAQGAAFRDPRFPQLGPEELTEIQISVSVLSPSEPMQISSREDLLAQLQPGRDGLILTEGAQRATFLPQVWEQLPDKGDFVAQLLRKAGLPGDYWSPALRASRYRSISFAEPVPRSPGTAGPA